MLNDISKYFTDEEKVKDLATKLLEKIHPNGGSGFISDRRASFSSPKWSAMALDVLNEWCLMSEEVFGDELFWVLEKVLPHAAQAFKRELVPNLESEEGAYIRLYRKSCV